MREGFLCVVLILLFSCQKTADKNQLPVPTCEGKHQLGFFVNHEAWIPSDTEMYKEHELPTVKFDDGLIRISATRVDEKSQSRNWFCIETENPELKEGKYKIANSTCKAAYQTYYYGANKEKESELYTLSQSSTNEIDFTCIDIKNGIIAGTFSFEAENSRGENLRFSSGRFDLILEK